MGSDLGVKTKLVLIAFGFSLVFGGLVSAQEAGVGGIGGRPAFPRENNPRSDSIFIHTINPGSSVDDGIKVINNSDSERTVIVYATDSIPSSGGAFACKQKVEDKIEVGSWINLEQNQVTLASAESKVIPFTIDVPDGVDVGEHNGCIVIQEEKPSENPDQGIGLSFRTAIRTAVLIPGEIEKNLEILDLSTVVHSDKVVVTPLVKNTGNVSVDADVETMLSYPFGINLSTVGGQFPVLRDQDTQWNFDHDRPFWGGLVKPSLEVSYDSSGNTFIGDESEDVQFISYDAGWIFIAPQPLAIAIYIAVILALVYLVYRLSKSRKLKADIKKNWKSHKVGASEDIKSIAKDNDISWKKLAKANGLKAPYTLESGQSIKVPKVKKDES